MTQGPYSNLTVNQMQARLTVLDMEISNAIEEQHQICEELMNRVPPDQTEVDWSVVREAVIDASDYDGIATGALEASFKTSGLLVMHRDELETKPPPKPIVVCTCGKPLANPAEYADHCKEFPSHFVHTATETP